MKKFLTIALVLMLLAVFTMPVFASAATSPGIKPGSFFYFFDVTFEKIGLLFTFSPEKKAEKALAYADERLAEVEALADEQNPNAVKTAITNYESNVALATEKSKEVKDKGQAESLLTLIADNTSRNQEVLAAVLIKVPEEAKEAITKAIEASRKGQEEAIRQIAELKSEIEQLKKEVAELKAKDETQVKTNEGLNKQKAENANAPQKPSVPPVSETAKNQNPTTPPPFQVPTKVSEPQSTPLVNQFPSNTTNTPSSQTTQPQTATPPPPTTTQTTPSVTQPTTTPTPTPTPPTPTPAPEPTLAPKIVVSVSSDNSVGRNIIKGEKGVMVLGLNIENSGGTNVRIDNLKLRLVGTSFSNLQDLKIKIGGQLYSAGSTNGDIKTYNPSYTLNPKSPIQILVQADVALTANSDSFHVEIVEVSGANDISGEGAKTSDVITGNTFTIYQPPVTSNSPTLSLAPNTVFGLTDNQCTSGCSYIGTILRFDAKNNPFSVLRLALTFNGVNESDFKNVKLLWGGNVYYNLYPTATNSATGQKVAYIEGNKIIFQGFSPYELFHVNQNEILDLTIKFESNPTGIGKTIHIDLVNPLTDIIASNYETGLVLPVGGSAVGNAIFISKQ